MFDLLIIVLAIQIVGYLVIRWYINLEMSWKHPKLHEELGSPTSLVTFGWMEFEAFIRDGQFEDQLSDSQNLIHLCKILRALKFIGYILFVLLLFSLVAKYGISNT